jgi:hypothetical protein
MISESQPHRSLRLLHGGRLTKLPTHNRVTTHYYEPSRLPWGKSEPVGTCTTPTILVHYARLCRILLGRGSVSRRLKPALLFLTIPCLHLAGLLGGLHRVSPYIARAAVSPCTASCSATPFGASPAWTGDGVFHSFQRCASWRTNLTLSD